jgi:hypothetical protein
MYVAVIQGSAFLWHQVRSMMAILFLIGKGFEDINLIETMLDKEFSFKTKLNYQIASDFPLILTNCQYEGISFKNNILNLSEIYENLKDIFENNLIEIGISTRMIKFFSIILKPLYIEKCESIKEDENRIFQFIENNCRNKEQKYSKLLNTKRNKNI